MVMSPALAGATPAAWPDLKHPNGDLIAGSEDAAVVIAIEDYAYAPDIAGARENAQAWYRWLRESRQVPTVKLLLDGEATRENMVETTLQLAGEVGASGKLWIVFIGHGAPDASTDDGILLGPDVQQTAASVASRGLSQATLLGHAQSAGAEVVMVVDSCFSGQTGEGELIPGLAPLKPVSARVQPRATLFLAARSQQYAGPLPGGERPAFSYLLLGGLQGWADVDEDGAVTAQEANGWVAGVLAANLTDRNQTPVLASEEPYVVMSRPQAPLAAPDVGDIVAAARMEAKRRPVETTTALKRHRSRGWAAAGIATGLLAGGAFAVHGVAHSGYPDEPDADKAESLYSLNRTAGFTGIGLAVGAGGLVAIAAIQGEW